MMVVIFSNDSNDTLAEEASVTAYVDRTHLGSGLLTVSESCVCWRDASTDRQMELQYEQVMLHAVSQETANFPHQPHLYLMVEKSGLDIVPSLSSATDHIEQSFRQLSTGGDSGDVHHHADGSGDSEGSGEGAVEVRFVPVDSCRLSALFEAMNRGQSAHPDPGLSLSDCDEMSGEERVNGVNVDTESEDESPNHVGINGSAYTSANHPTDPRQFDDDDD